MSEPIRLLSSELIDSPADLAPVSAGDNGITGFVAREETDFFPKRKKKF